MFLSTDANPPTSVAQFTAMCFVQDHPGQLNAAKAPCQLTEIKWKQGKSTGNQKVPNPPYIEAGDSCEIRMVPKMPICIAAYSDCKPLARIAAMDSNSLVMLGKVTAVVAKEEK